jgi:DNA-binding GntR family transcriptional regulator
VPAVRLRHPETRLLRHRAVARIQDAIWSGAYPPGTHLTETTLAAHLGISRGPIREAIQELVRQGLVVAIPNRGAFVARWSVEDVIELYGVRSVLEGLAARIAVRRLPAAQLLPPFERIIGEMRETAHLGQLMRLVNLEMAFHQTLARSSGNKRLIRIHDDLSAQIKMLIAAAEVRLRLYDDPMEIAELHVPILEALRSTDAGAAAREAEEHVRRAGERLTQHMLAGSLP